MDTGKAFLGRKMEQQKSFFAKWSEFFITRYRITLVIIIAIILGGVFGAFTLVRESFPKIDIPLALVTTTFPGATSTDVEKKVSQPIEEAARSVSDVDNITSYSSDSVSVVLVEFESDVDLDRKIEELDAAISKAELPGEVKKPEVTEVEAFINLVVTVAGEHDFAQLQEAAEVVKDEINREVSGIEKIDIVGGTDKQIKVSLDLVKLSQVGLTVSQLRELLSAKNVIIPGGSLEKGGKEFTISVLGDVDSVKEVKDLSVGVKPDGRPVRLKDIASVEISPEEPESLYRTGYRKSGALISKNSVYLFITKRSEADITKISKQVERALEKLKDDDRLPSNTDLIITYDDSTMVNRQISDLVTSGWQGLIIIFIVLFIFVSFRSSIVISTVIPLVMLSVFMIFRMLDLSLNVITLFSIILTLGILVDNAIVIVEAVQYNLNRGYKAKEAALVAISEVGAPVFSATVTTIIVFIPMIYIGGLIGKFIAYIPYTVITAIASSFLIAVTVTPLLGTWIIRARSGYEGDKIKEYSEVKHWRLIDWYGQMMEKILKSLPRMGLVILLAAVLFAFSMWIPLTGKLKMEQFPTEDSEFFYVNISFDRGAPFSSKNKIVRDIEEEIKMLPHLISYSVTPLGSDISIFVSITDPRHRKLTSFDITDQLEEGIGDVEGAEVRIVGVTAGPPAADYPIIVQVNEDDLGKTKVAAKDLADYLESVDGVKRVRDGVSGEEVPQIRISLDRKKMDRYGLLPAAVGAQIRDVYQPQESTKVRLSGSDKSIPLQVSVEEKSRDTVDELKNLAIISPLGPVALKDIASVKEVEELATINRFDQRRFIQVSALTEEDANNREIEEKIREYMDKDKLEELGLKEDALSFRGQYALDIEALDKIYLLLILALILVFLVLVAQFNSFSQPLIIMAAIPLAIIGVFPGLWLTHSVLSFLANLGVVALIGIVVNDAIVLVSYSNLLRKKGLTRREALVEAGKIRFRPIFSTSLTTIGGILPLTIILTYWRPIGTAIISGLLFATVGTLVVVPCIFAFMSGLWDKILVKLGKEPD